jgi:predicted outer membrane protein
MISSTDGQSFSRAFLLAIAVIICALGPLAVATEAQAGEGSGRTSQKPAPTAADAAGRLRIAPVAVTGAAGEPLTEADKDLTVKVKLAGLWEIPAGRMAAEKGVNPRVREIGTMIADQHVQLDKIVETAAAKIGVPLPDQPNADQTKWLGEMTAASGAQFDQIYVDRLRAAHGKIFPAIGAVRSGTRNTVVRELAQSANGFVLTHLTLLESTGLVKYSTLPEPPAPAPAAGAAQVPAVGGVTSAADSPFWFLWVVVPVVLLMVGWRVLRSAPWRRDDDLDDDAPSRSSGRGPSRGRLPRQEPVLARGGRRPDYGPDYGPDPWPTRSGPPSRSRSDDWAPVPAGSRQGTDRYQPPSALPSPYGYGGEPPPLDSGRRSGSSPRYRS